MSLDDFSLPSDGAVKKAELEMAKTLVGHLAAKWEPEKYTDEYRDNLMRIIQAKAKGKKITLESPETPRQAKVVDLMERLRRSLAEKGARPAKAGTSTARRKTTGQARKPKKRTAA